jgi:hypothetical protein
MERYLPVYFFHNDMNSVPLIVTDIVLHLSELFALLFSVEEDDSS